MPRWFIMAWSGHELSFTAESDGAQDPLLSWSWLRGESLPARPLRVRWVRGRRKPSDIVWVDSYAFLIGERLADVLRSNGITGWATSPVDFTGKHGESISGYRLFIATGRCGPIDYSRSVPVMAAPHGFLVPGWRGMHFNEALWTGEDIVVPDKYGGVVVSERVSNVLKRAKVGNVRFACMEEIFLSSVTDPITGEPVGADQYVDQPSLWLRRFGHGKPHVA